jgi:hypothetical protein
MGWTKAFGTSSYTCAVTIDKGTVEVVMQSTESEMPGPKNGKFSNVIVNLNGVLYGSGPLHITNSEVKSGDPDEILSLYISASDENSHKVIELRFKGGRNNKNSFFINFPDLKVPVTKKFFCNQNA